MKGFQRGITATAELRKTSLPPTSDGKLTLSDSSTPVTKNLKKIAFLEIFTAHRVSGESSPVQITP
jgi:hypothetical protein